VSMGTKPKERNTRVRVSWVSSFRDSVRGRESRKPRKFLGWMISAMITRSKSITIGLGSVKAQPLARLLEAKPNDQYNRGN